MNNYQDNIIAKEVPEPKSFGSDAAGRTIKQEPNAVPSAVFDEDEETVGNEIYCQEVMSSSAIPVVVKVKTERAAYHEETDVEDSASSKEDGEEEDEEDIAALIYQDTQRRKREAAADEKEEGRKAAPKKHRKASLSRNVSAAIAPADKGTKKTDGSQDKHHRGNKDGDGEKKGGNGNNEAGGGGSGCNNEHVAKCSYPSCEVVSQTDAECFFCSTHYHNKCKTSYEESSQITAPEQWAICYNCHPSKDEWVRELSKLNRSIRHHFTMLKRSCGSVNDVWRDIASKWNQQYNAFLEAIRVLPILILIPLPKPHVDPQTVDRVDKIFGGVLDDVYDIAALVHVYGDNLRLEQVQIMFDVFGVPLQIERAVPALPTQEQALPTQASLSLLAHTSAESHPNVEVDASEANPTKKKKTGKKESTEIVLNPPVHITCRCCSRKLLAPFRPPQYCGVIIPILLFRSQSDVAGASKNWEGHRGIVFPKPMQNTTNVTRSTTYHPFGRYEDGTLVKEITQSFKDIGSSLRIIPIRGFINLYMNRLDESVVSSAYGRFIDNLTDLVKRRNVLTTTDIQKCFFTVFTSLGDAFLHQKVSEAWTNNNDQKEKLKGNPSYKDKINGVSKAWIPKVKNAVSKVFQVLKCEDTNTTVELGKMIEEDGKAIKDLLMKNLYLSLESELDEALTRYVGREDDVHGQVLEGSSSAELKSYFEEKSELLALIIHYHFLDVLEFVKTGLKMAVTDQK